MQVQQFRTLTLIILIRKRTLEFIGEIEDIIENDPNKLVSYIDSDIGMSKFPIWQ